MFQLPFDRIGFRKQKRCIQYPYLTTDLCPVKADWMHPVFCSMSWPEGLSTAKSSGMTMIGKISWQDLLKSWMKEKQAGYGKERIGKK